MVKDGLEKFIEDPGYDFIERKVKFKPDQAEKIHKFVNIGVLMMAEFQEISFFKILIRN